MPAKSICHAIIAMSFSGMESIVCPIPPPRTALLVCTMDYCSTVLT